MTRRKRARGERTIYNTLHRKLKIDQKKTIYYLCADIMTLNTYMPMMYATFDVKGKLIFYAYLVRHCGISCFSFY